jgi:hypothetical protein
VAVLQFSNHNVAVFDNYGRLVKLSLTSLNRQNATLNFHLIKVQVQAVSFSSDTLLAMTAEALHVFPLKRSKVPATNHQVLRHCRKIAVAFPVNVLQGVLIEDQLFNH